MENLEEEFQKSVDRIRRKSTFVSDELLGLYGLYKQITEGNCITAEPWHNEVIEHGRWEAWHKNMYMGREEGMKKYIEMVNELMKS
jgi:acyl-CoA-binding protein